MLKCFSKAIMAMLFGSIAICNFVACGDKHNETEEPREDSIVETLIGLAENNVTITEIYENGEVYIVTFSNDEIFNIPLSKTGIIDVVINKDCVYFVRNNNKVIKISIEPNDSGNQENPSSSDTPNSTGNPDNQTTPDDEESPDTPTNSDDETTQDEDDAPNIPIYNPETPITVPEGFVDLGLPDFFVAECNLGSSKPEGYGNYYAWGEINKKSDYSPSNSTTYNKSVTTLRNNGVIDASGNLTPSYDIASKTYGFKSGIRLPTQAEMTLLQTKCTWIWTTMNGVNGYEIVGPNGNSIFLPATGMYIGKTCYNANSNGSYWTSSDFDGTEKAYNVGFGSDDYDLHGHSRYVGCAIRPVCDK